MIEKYFKGRLALLPYPNNHGLDSNSTECRECLEDPLKLSCVQQVLDSYSAKRSSRWSLKAVFNRLTKG